MFKTQVKQRAAGELFHSSCHFSCLSAPNSGLNNYGGFEKQKKTSKITTLNSLKKGERRQK